MAKLRVAIHKLTSCSGCQLAILNQGAQLLDLLEDIDIVHFIEGGLYEPDASVDLALIEGSVTTPEDLQRLQHARSNSKLLVSIGACATSGGVQALRNMQDERAWKQAIYAKPEFIDTLANSTPIKAHAKVDFELWGCPITIEQLNNLIRQLRFGTLPIDNKEKLCMECKRRQQVCVMVTRQAPCLGPVTRTACGALCPAFGRACYGCFGPSEQPNGKSLGKRFAGLGLMPAQIAQRFASIHSQSPDFNEQYHHWQALDPKLSEEDKQ
ncbi:hypothetical protein P2G88_18210 [Aliiglaciecola sp. CAU 1673]|uniref:NADH-quinone oxidoreductase subunit B family protein n=1 Tax=Aliiglaciecola sp. CAU 1673 TaxID=3032595 RepID=UPI0023DC4F3C|nr:hypothetical protein [Aliiglaciecola sp. CAU 1673]MDF2180193.1 hypothetical protein [Aliiglaciecola sp. CAU 1673]